MVDYNLSGLNWRDFEHVVQALAKKYIGPGVTPFGDGRDGGREATFEGRMAYPAAPAGWEGYLVVQCKFLKKPTGDTSKDGLWILREVTKELRKLSKSRDKHRLPDYYIVVTNVALTAVPERGSKDRLKALLRDSKFNLNFKDVDVWSYDELCRFIDDSFDIRRAYAGFITVGDVLSQTMSFLTNLRPEFADTMNSFLQKELRNEQAARLESAGQHHDQQISLAKVFIDLPVTETLDKSSHAQKSLDDEDYFPAVSTLLESGTSSLRQRPFETSKGALADVTYSDTPRSRYVLVGGPGQGKSTVGQYLCQLYRAAIIRDRPPQSVDPLVKQIIRQLEEQRKADGVSLPKVRRFPLRIVLNQYADELAQHPDTTLLRYICKEISRLSATECSTADLKGWLAAYPWLVVLDGLDEVPASSNRSNVLKEIEDFRIEASTVDADLLLVATTRPQGYSSEFSPDLFRHLYLVPLSEEQALSYGKRLSEARCGTDDVRRELIVKRLAKASETTATARLMRSPLQVTIMATLVERIGEPPRQRYRLFEQYYRTIYDREVNRESILSEVLSNRKTDIDLIHYRTGLLLQTHSEHAGRTEARLTDDGFRELVNARLQEVEESGPQAEQLMSLITPSIDRLVFIVRPQQGTVGFEIRSLQEFMAAEALLQGRDHDVKQRLREIAPVQHWRNVLLFAVGKCFAEHEHYLEYIDFLCRELNDSGYDPAAQEVRLGSRLALDILLEGVAKQNPRFERSLARNALELISLPDQSANIRLASAYESHLDDLFRKAVDDHLARSGFERTGLWAILSSLADRDVEWAVEQIQRRYSRDRTPSLYTLLSQSFRSCSDWLVRMVAEHLSSEPLHPLLAYLRAANISEESNAPRWLIALARSRRYGKRSANGLAEFNLSGSGSVGAVWLNSFFEINLASLIPLRDIPGESSEWEPLRAIGRFAAAPTKEVLAAELLHLSKTCGASDDMESVLPYMPWPLAACVASAHNAEGLRMFAESVAAGKLGGPNEWTAAEHRWQQHGVRSSDIEAMTDERWPFDRIIATSGFPFAAASGGIHPRSLQKALRTYRQLNSSRMKSWLAFTLVSIDMPISENSDPYASADFEPHEFQELMTLASEKNPLFVSDLVKVISPPPMPDPQWARAFNWIGQHSNRLHLHIQNEWPWTMSLTHSFLLDPLNHRGLLNVLGRAAITGNTVEIPELLADPKTLEADYARAGAILIRFTARDLEDGKISAYAQMLLENSSLRFELYSIAASTAVPVQRRSKLILEVLRMLPETMDDRTHISGPLIRALVQILDGRATRLNDPQHWKKLALPIVGN